MTALTMVTRGSAPPRPEPTAARTGPPQHARWRARVQTKLVDGYIATDLGAGARRPDAAGQRHRLRAWAAYRGWRLARIVEDTLAHTSPGPRPMLCEALERVESRDSDGILTPSIDAIARSLSEAAGVIERIDAARGTFLSVREQVDTSTPAGRLMLRLLLSLAHREDVARADALPGFARLPAAGQLGDELRPRPHPEFAVHLGEMRLDAAHAHI